MAGKACLFYMFIYVYISKISQIYVEAITYGCVDVTISSYVLVRTLINGGVEETATGISIASQSTKLFW